MIRNCTLDEISDGNLYTENDLVKADTINCEGCKSVCCHGMENTIILEPYDMHILTKHLGASFDEMLKTEIVINQVDGILLPNLAMNKETNSCSFLDENKRCRIHKARPALCRLFPLGRYWESENSFKYILQKDQCKKDNLAKIKVKKWLDIDNLAEYNEYVVLWHIYTCKIKSAVSDIMTAVQNGSVESQLATTQIKTICMYTLKVFYQTPYDEETFFEEFKNRIKNALTALGLD